MAVHVLAAPGTECGAQSGIGQQALQRRLELRVGGEPQTTAGSLAVFARRVARALTITGTHSSHASMTTSEKDSSAEGEIETVASLDDVALVGLAHGAG